MEVKNFLTKGKRMRRVKKNKWAASRESIVQLPDELVFEILARVSDTKALYQFKGVCKPWRSIIEGPGFFEAHRNRHCGTLVLCIPEAMKKRDHDTFLSTGVFRGPAQVNFFCSTILAHQAKPFFRRSTVPLPNSFMGFTQVVNGLACLYETTRLFVCNVCTGETKRLPDIQDVKDGSKFYLGYDATSRVYKMLKLNLVKQIAWSYLRLECQVLTLGRDSSWRDLGAAGSPTLRRLDVEGKQIFCSDEPLLVNGVMYWVMENRVQPPKLISFDLNKEEFRLLQPPEDPLFSVWEDEWDFAQLGGRPALYRFSETRPTYLSYYTLDDDDDDQGNSWSSHSIPLPRGFEDLVRYNTPVAVGNLPRGQTLFVNVRLPSDLLKCYHTTVYSYDHETKEFGKLLVGQISHPLPHPVAELCFLHRRMVTCLQENTAPLDVQLSVGA